MSIVYKDIIEKLKAAGYTTYYLRKNKLISEGTLQRIRDGKHITTETIDTICELLNCKIEDIVEYIPTNKKDTE